MRRRRKRRGRRRCRRPCQFECSAFSAVIVIVVVLSQNVCFSSLLFFVSILISRRVIVYSTHSHTDMRTHEGRLWYVKWCASWIGAHHTPQSTSSDDGFDKNQSFLKRWWIHHSFTASHHHWQCGCCCCCHRLRRIHSRRLVASSCMRLCDIIGIQVKHPWQWIVYYDASEPFNMRHRLCTCVPQAQSVGTDIVKAMATWNIQIITL